MAQAQKALSQHTNGRNGTGPSAARLEDTDETRKQIAVLAVTGSVGDAEALYFAMPGSSREGWDYLRRVSLLVRTFVLHGDPPYLRPLSIAQHSGVMTPQGDCADDALPLDQQNQARKALREAMDKNGDL